MKSLRSIVSAVFLLMVCTAAIQRAQSGNGGLVLGIANSEIQILREREQYQRTIAARLDEYTDRLNKLSAAVEKSRGRVKASLRARATELDMKITSARQRFNELAAATDPTWTDAKPKMDQALKELEAS